MAWLLIRAERKRTAAARRFVGSAMTPRLIPRLGGARPWLKGSLLVLALAMLIAAAARPRFGVYFEKVVRRGVDCFIMLDVSRSMLAEDVAPNRLERAKSDIRDLLKKLGGDRVGLIVFAGKPVLKAPLTTDKEFFLSVLDDVDPHSAPRGGTLIGDAIRKALEYMKPQSDRDQVLVIFTDGEDQDSFADEAAGQAAERGVKIFTVGLGDSAEGARIPMRDGEGNLVYLKENGQEHWSKTNHDILAKIAKAAKGVHVPAGTKAYDMGEVYENHLANLARSDEELGQNRKRHHDRYQIFLMLGVLLLATDMAIPAHSNKCSAATLGRDEQHTQPRAAVPPSAKACVLAALLLMPSQALASVSEAASKVNQGLDAFRGGDFQAAADAFTAADQAMPKQSLIAFNLGCAYAAEEKYEEAAGQFRTAALSSDAKLAAAAHYNLGCLALSKAKAALGEKPEEAVGVARGEALIAVNQAAIDFRDALKVDPQHENARCNLESVRLWTKYIEEAWRRRDRDKLRKELDLLKFLEMLEGRQREMRTGSRALAEQAPSPLRRESIRAIKKRQRYLADEIEPLKEKIAAALNGNQQPDGAATAQIGADAEKVLTLLNNLADTAHGSMDAAADLLDAGDLSEAAAAQADAVENLDQLYMAVAPFVDLVKKAIKTQEGVKGDLEEAAWEQKFVTGYCRILPAKAQRELKQLEKTPAEAQPVLPAPQDGKLEDAARAAETQKKQREEMKRALTAGVELSPKAGNLSKEATGLLEEGRGDNALPLQEEILKLLNEMLPKDEQNKNDRRQQDQQNRQEQKNKDRNKQDQKNKDEKDKNQQKIDRQKQEQQKKDQAKAQPQQGKQKELSKQEAEAIKRRARERRRQRKETEKELQAIIRRSEKVDKDW